MPFPSISFNSTHLPHPKIIFPTSVTTSLGILTHAFIYPISVLLQRTVHTLTCFLTDHCETVFSPSLPPPGAPRSGDCPWGNCTSLFPALILASVSGNADHFLTPSPPSLSQNTTFPRFNVLLFFRQLLLSPLLASAAEWRYFPCFVPCPPMSPSCLPHGFKQGSKEGLLGLLL